jgi:hypothetical protein
MRTVAKLFFLTCAVLVLSAQVSPAGVDASQQRLQEVSITKFEDAGFWFGSMPLDMGLITTRRFEGAPLDKEPIEAEQNANIRETDRFVLGAKVQFFARGYSYFLLTPARPLPVEGITKTLSVWVVGRNINHRLVVLISDNFGNRAEIIMGKLNFSGWRQMTVAIPPNIKQRDYRYGNRQGIKIEGFRIDCDPLEASGTYYIYFDDMRAVTDLFSEEIRDEDDIQDNW